MQKTSAGCPKWALKRKPAPATARIILHTDILRKRGEVPVKTPPRPRKLLGQVRDADTHAEPEMVAFKLTIWSWQLNDAQRGGLTSRQFVRYHLPRLKLGDNLTHITTGKSTRRPIASPDEVLALRPELRSTD